MNVLFNMTEPSFGTTGETPVSTGASAFPGQLPGGIYNLGARGGWKAENPGL
ncbi:hypothetical protein GCM10010317_027290 [Streptomyces mirabilis]|nr:hypothetical protein GCM10010317_027290 [Streptomyces mirabilis]